SRPSSMTEIQSSTNLHTSNWAAYIIRKPSAIYVFKQPKLPQVHNIPLGSTTVSPISPAEFKYPLYMLSPMIKAEPTPLPNPSTTIVSLDLSLLNNFSAYAFNFSSLSMSTG